MRGKWNGAGKHGAIAGATSPRPWGFWGKKMDLFYILAYAASLGHRPYLPKQSGEHGDRCFFKCVLGGFQRFHMFWGRTPLGRPGLVALRPRRPWQPWQRPRFPSCSLFASPRALIPCTALGWVKYATGTFLFYFVSPKQTGPKEKGKAERKAGRHGCWARATLLFEGVWWEFAGLAGCRRHWGEMPGVAGSAIPAHRGLMWKMKEE